MTQPFLGPSEFGGGVGKGKVNMPWKQKALGGI